GQGMILLRSSATVKRALRNMRLDSFFTFAAAESEALQLLKAAQHFEPALNRSPRGAEPQVLTWRGEITAANAPCVWKATETYIQTHASRHAKLCIDLEELRFIDSTGVGLMIRAKKSAARAGSVLTFSDAQAAVRNVIRICRLEGFLLGDSL